ncbi:alpha/beta hydrolase [Antrihabitans sp. YC3-6]|uniref:Alpha/beta hydrolase n=1 Tax=Antrihabitans stalagmiti TaxID=2799499 RepID=A0A934NQK5_9NOCA|nr:alpha/beta hydrolase [Antrihabitans stalagmiti]MBJ8339457.1 alpha/beta hydrolase [Antrihabitans stalagmiti]
MTQTTQTTPDTETPPPWQAEVAAHKRAMPMQRLIGNGMDYAEVVELYALADSGVPWAVAAARIGTRIADTAHAALRAGHRVTAHSDYLRASACFRVGQVPLPDSDPRKKSMYHKLIEFYGAAGDLTDPAVEHVEIPYQGGHLCGWLLRPPGVTAPPVVIVMGGFDGWREEYHVGATYLLDRGVAAFLVDGPGQGETRILHGLHLTPDVPKAFSAMVDHLYADDRLADRVGIWGNSMGGFLAALTAATDDRIDACCVNGGTVRPAEILNRYRRFITKVQALLGIDDPIHAKTVMDSFVLTDDTLASLHCPLHVMHGTPDQIFLIENARALFERAASTDKTWSEFPDGDHCIYNHSHDKHTRIADWFADRLTEGHPRWPPPSAPIFLRAAS